MRITITHITCLWLSFVWLAGPMDVWGLARGPAVYYVDAEAGHDANSGLMPSKAWKTIERVNGNQFQQGDSVLFKSGCVFNGRLKPNFLGTSGAISVVSSYGKGPKPIVNGNGTMPAAVWVYNMSRIEISNLHITNTGSQRQAALAGIKVQLEDYGTAFNVTLKNLNVEGVNGSLVKKEGGGCGILVQNGGDSEVSIFNGLTIEGCSIKRCERNGIIFGSYWSREKWHPNLNVVIRRNLIEEVPGDGIVPIGCDGALIEHNVMRNCTRLLPLGEAAAGIWPWSCDNTVVQHNEVSGHKAPWDGQGFDSDWNCRNTIIQYNYSHDNEGGFVLVCNDGSVGKAFNAGNTGTVIRYNVSLNDGNRKHKTHAGVFSPVVHFAGPATQTRFYNNLIIHTGEVNDTLDNSFVHFSSWDGMPGHTLFANNVFLSQSSTSIDLNNAVGVDFGHNIFSGLFANLPVGNGNAEHLLDGPIWELPMALPQGFEYLSRYKIEKTFEGYEMGMGIEKNAVLDFFGNLVGQGTLNIGIDQTKFNK